MGNPRVQENRTRRLVVLSPFFMKRTETTVAELRAAGLTAVAWSGNSAGTANADYCTFTPSAGPNEKKPVNCLPRSTAEAYCKKRQGALPTEAQFEYVASKLDSSLFVWGDDGNTVCADAALGRSGWGIHSGSPAPCSPKTPPGGAIDVGTSPRDGLDVSGGRVVDLVGNLSELARDRWNDTCSASGLSTDPSCDTGTLDVFRGGSWEVTPQHASAAAREPLPANSISGAIDFRCARSDG